MTRGGLRKSAMKMCWLPPPVSPAARVCTAVSFSAKLDAKNTLENLGVPASQIALFCAFFSWLLSP